eukprot:TRINITY_DN59122_c0_g1_i1.p1 TRINITY_DN59122_c0_g1~~TRINITY_DN59122_c0_g1_i1.p1  ORF type:complete len:662 (+),score=138.57 TRINITY_DN59122_c0_g1_i1:66-1988(+)
MAGGKRPEDESGGNERGRSGGWLASATSLVRQGLSLLGKDSEQAAEDDALRKRFGDHLFWEDEEQSAATPACSSSSCPEQLWKMMELAPLLELPAEAAPDQWWDLSVLCNRETDDYIAISKPPWMTAPHNLKAQFEASDRNLAHRVHCCIPDLPSGKEDAERRGMCHRLDVGMSGVQVIARTLESRRRFDDLVAEQKVRFDYLVLVEGSMNGERDSPEGIVDVPMRMWADNARRDYGAATCHRGRRAVTKYKTLRTWQVPPSGTLERLFKKERLFSLLQLQTMTDRPQQVRAHMAFIGHPIVGDLKYNNANHEADCAIVPRMFVHCYRVHAQEDSGVGFSEAACDLPPDLQAALVLLESLSSAPSWDASEVERRSAKAGEVLPLQRRFMCPACDEETIERCCPLLRKGADEAAGSTARRPVLWQLLKADGCPGASAEDTEAADAKGMEKWGSRTQWLPSVLLDKVQNLATQRAAAQLPLVPQLSTPTDEGVEDADKWELGKHWGASGARWAWSADANRQNGWVRLLRDGKLQTKWNVGLWDLWTPDWSDDLEEPPLLRLTWNHVEHTMRLVLDDESPHLGGLSKMECVARRYLKRGEVSVTEEAGDLSGLKTMEMSRCCDNVGWPQGSLSVPKEQHRVAA